MVSSTLLILVGLLAVVVADFEVAFMKPCKNDTQDACIVTGVRIDPCPTHKKKFCKLRKGETAHIEFDFIPKFNATSLKAAIYCEGTRFTGMNDDDACKLTSCPTVDGQSQRFHFDLYIGKKLPTGVFAMNWKVWNEENSAEICCFISSVKLVK